MTRSRPTPTPDVFVDYKSYFYSFTFIKSCKLLVLMENSQGRRIDLQLATQNCKNMPHLIMLKASYFRDLPVHGTEQ